MIHHEGHEGSGRAAVARFSFASLWPSWFTLFSENRTKVMTENANPGGRAETIAGVMEVLARPDRTRLGAAERSLLQWLKDHPTDVVALKLIGNVYLRLSRHEEAEKQLSRALALAPQFAEARWLLVGTYVYRGNWKEALANTDT